MLKAQKIKLQPNSTMIKVIEELFSYSRYCYNQALEIWNTMYDSSVLLEDKSLRPNWRKVRNKLVSNKADWQYTYSARVLQQSCSNLGKAWDNFFNPNMPDSGKPKFKSKKYSKKTFTTDRARFKNNKLILDKPREDRHSGWYGIRLREPVRFTGKLKLVTVTKDVSGYYASLVFDVDDTDYPKPTKDKVAVDCNVRRLTYGNEDSINTKIVYPKSLDKLYERIKVYQRLLAKKQVANPTNFRSNNYNKVRTKLQRDYLKVSNIQHDLLQKFTTDLVKNYQEIHIEDLDVKHMLMNKHISKNLQRSLFSEFRRELTYKCDWYNRDLVVVSKDYPSTQLCSNCGYRKTKDSYGGKQTLSGDSIHREHQKYYCYNCGSVLDRDENAVINILNYKE